MTTVRFSVDDGHLMGCLPDQGGDLACWVDVYKFIQRDAAPGYDRIAGCIRRAVAAGVLSVPTDGVYRLAPVWWARLQEFVEAAHGTEYGIFDFAEWLATLDVPVIGPTELVLGREEYESALARR